MMNKTFFAVLTIAMIFTCKAETHISQSVNELILRKTTPQKTLYVGKVMSAKSAELAFPKDGRLTYISPIGTLVKSELTDKKGKVLNNGDLLSSQDPIPYELEVKVSEIKLNVAKARYKESKTVYDRNLKLSKKNVISSKTLLHSETVCETAKSSVYEATQDLDKAKYELDTCYIFAPFRGIVEEVFYDIGTSVGKGKPVLRLSLLSPAKIRVKLSRDLIRKLNLCNTFNIFPSGSKISIPGWLDLRRYITKDYIDLLVVNKPVGVQLLSKEQEKMPKVHKLLFASNISDFEGQIPLWVPPATIHEDDQGYYVLRANGQFLGKPVAPEFRIEKIWIKPLDKYMFQGIYKQRALCDSGTLKKHQLLVTESSVKLNDGDNAALQELSWEFSPGEEVWVRIPGIENSGYYVPAQSVFSSQKGHHFIFADINGKAQKVNIEILNEYEDLFKISGKDIKNGLQLIIPSDGQIITENEHVVQADKKIN